MTNMQDKTDITKNPMELIEDILEQHEWAFERDAADELIVDLRGGWCDYRLFFVWQEDFSSLQFCCQFDLTVPEELEGEVARLMHYMNEQIWLGFFLTGSEDRTPMFRYTLLLSGQEHASPEQLEDLIEVALSECDRVYPALSFILNEGKTAEEAFANAIIETAGEA